MVQVTEEDKRVIGKVEKSVCGFLGVKEQALVNNDMTIDTSLARGFVMYILHVEYGMSIQKLCLTYFRTKQGIYWQINKIKAFLKLKRYREMYDSFGIIN